MLLAAARFLGRNELAALTAVTPVREKQTGWCKQPLTNLTAVTAQIGLRRRR